MINKDLYLFDFDGTISNKDSFGHFFLKSFGIKHVLIKLLLNAPILIFTFLTHQKKSKTKELITSILLKGKTLAEIEKLGEYYHLHHINEILRPNAIVMINKLKEDDSNNVWIVSASLDIWLKPFAKGLNVGLLCTEIEYEDAKFTGSFKSANCKGVEKVNRIKKDLDLNHFNNIISFGDSKGDLEMFKISTQYNYKPFK